MRNRARFVSFAVVVALAGCGGTNKAATTAPAPASSVSTPTTTTGGAPSHVKPATYNVKLTGTKEAGEPTGSAHAVLKINAANNELCWTFSELRNVTVPTGVNITGHVHGVGTLSTPLGRYQPVGCSQEPQLLLELFERTPQNFFVNIKNVQHPFGAVRGRL